VIIVNKDAEALIKTRFKCTAKKKIYILHFIVQSKNAGLSNVDRPKCWVKNVIKNLQFKVKVEVGLEL